MPAFASSDLDLYLGGMSPYLDHVTGGDHEKRVRLLTLASQAAHSRFERELQIAIDRRVIKMQPDPALVLGKDYDEEEAPLDYISGQISNSRLPRYRLRRRPVISIERMVLAFSKEFQVLEVPTEWLRLNKHMGVVDIVPVGAAAHVALQHGLWFMPLVENKWPWRALPQFIQIDYTAGSVNPLTDPFFDEMRVALLNAAAGELCKSLRNLLPNSMSVDGLTHALDAVSRRIEQSEQETREFLKSWQQQHRPPKLVVFG